MNTTTSSAAADISAGIAVAQGLAPLLPPNVQKAVAIAAAAASVVNAWAQAAQAADITDAQLQGLFDQFAINKADDLAAQAQASGSISAPPAI